MDEYLNSNRRLWDEWTHINSRSNLYQLEDFKAGANKLNPLEREEVGEVAGKSLLHLQCHFGMDTLSWARLGAQVTGVDFSPEAVKLARQLSAELNIPARFIESDIYQLPEVLDEQFDIVYTSYGVLTWLPDIKRWAEIAASYVRAGGIFYIAEFHPFAWIFDYEAKDLQVRFPYFQEEVGGYEVSGSYADTSAVTETKTSYEWAHPLGEIVTALIQAGLQLEFLHEFPYTVYEQFSFVEKADAHYWQLPGGAQTIPLMFSIRAKKPE